MTEPGLWAAEHSRLNSFMVDIAGAARGTPVADSAGNHRFGGKGALCVYANGQFHDYSGGAREHGRSAFQLIEHLYLNEDATIWARAWLACHSGVGAFVPGESGEPTDDSPMSRPRAMSRASTMARSPQQRHARLHLRHPDARSALRPGDASLLRWVADYRGAEGALITPLIDDNGKIVKLLVTFVTADGLKSPHEPARITVRGAKGPVLSPRIAWAEGGRV